MKLIKVINTIFFNQSPSFDMLFPPKLNPGFPGDYHANLANIMPQPRF